MKENKKIYWGRLDRVFTPLVFALIFGLTGFLIASLLFISLDIFKISVALDGDKK